MTLRAGADAGMPQAVRDVGVNFARVAALQLRKRMASSKKHEIDVCNPKNDLEFVNHKHNRPSEGPQVEKKGWASC